MSKKPRACKKCQTIHEENVCPNCGSKEFTESWKGKLIILNTEKSEIVKKFKIAKPGSYAIKTR